MLAEVGFGKFRWKKLDESTVRRNSRQMSSGGNRDTRLPKVGHDRQTTIFCQLTNPQSLCEPTHPANVRLNYLHLTAIHQIEKFKPGCEPLAGGDRNGLLLGKPRVTHKVVWRQGCLDKEKFERFPIPN